MPLLGFQEQFAAKVESGEKRQTIRAYRKDGRDPKVGDTLYFYTGPYTKERRKLGEAICTSVEPITLCSDREILGYRGFHDDWGPWPDCEQKFATADGFDNIEEMFDWFEKTHGLPFKGLLIRWGEVI